MTDPYTQWRSLSPDNEARAKIAEAMHPQTIEVMAKSCRDITDVPEFIPDVFTDPSASAALLDWLWEHGITMTTCVCWGNFSKDSAEWLVRLYRANEVVAATDYLEPMSSHELGVSRSASESLRRALALAAVKAIEVLP